ncbi:MAG TPA: hypothetical protein VL172_08545 [Kofleriaceae bacterium]|nr:hypothetical protein [Kofleriaceae bacterium]
MTKLFVSLSLTLGLALTACGSKGGGSACEDLNKKICDGKDAAYCQKSRDWLDKELTGPNGETMSSSEKDMACKLVGSDKDVIDAYRNQAAQALSASK